MENQLQFENLIDGLGPGCKNPMMYPAIRYYYCLGCDPKQPEYTDDSKGENGEIRVCSSFVDRIWRDGGREYDDCGVMKSNDVRPAHPLIPPLTPPRHPISRNRAEAPRSTPAHARPRPLARPPLSLTAARAAQCPIAWGDNDFDPYTCGDDLIIPRQEEYTNTAEKFLNFFKPPGLDDYDIVVVPDDESQGKCWNARAFSSGAAASLPRSASLLTTIAAVSALLLYR